MTLDAPTIPGIITPRRAKRKLRQVHEHEKQAVNRTPHNMTIYPAELHILHFENEVELNFS